MSRTKISQAEARRLRKRVDELERQETIRLKRWGSDYPGGVNIVTLNLGSDAVAILRTAQLLEHRLLVKVDTEGRAKVYAVRS